MKTASIAGGRLKSGGQSRNRTTDTRIFNPPVARRKVSRLSYGSSPNRRRFTRSLIKRNDAAPYNRYTATALPPQTSRDVNGCAQAISREPPTPKCSSQHAGWPPAKASDTRPPRKPRPRPSRAPIRASRPPGAPPASDPQLPSSPSSGAETDRPATAQRHRATVLPASSQARVRRHGGLAPARFTLAPARASRRRGLPTIKAAPHAPDLAPIPPCAANLDPDADRPEAARHR